MYIITHTHGIKINKIRKNHNQDLVCSRCQHSAIIISACEGHQAEVAQAVKAIATSPKSPTKPEVVW